MANNQFIKIGPRIWIRPATIGWVMYIGDTALYYAPEDKQKAQEAYEAAIIDGQWASPPMPAHMGS